MTTIEGKTVVQSFEIASRVCKEVGSLHELLQDQLTEAIGSASRENKTPWGIAAAAVSDARLDESEWLYTDILFALPLKCSGKGNKPIQCYVGYQVSILGDGIALPENKEPLLHVFCWADITPSFEDGNYLGFPAPDDEINGFNVVNNHLLLWGSENAAWNEKGWAFSLRLLQLNTPDDLQTQVIAPALALLNAQSVSTVSLANLPAIVRYPSKEELLK
jgi:hypothetical protein